VLISLGLSTLLESLVALLSILRLPLVMQQYCEAACSSTIADSLSYYLLVTPYSITAMLYSIHYECPSRSYLLHTI
jgi:hypothetical protein